LDLVIDLLLILLIVYEDLGMALIPVVAGEVGDWETPPVETNIAVGVRGSSYEIQLHLGTDTHVFSAGKPYNGITMIAKASQIRVINKGKADLNYEML